MAATKGAKTKRTTAAAVQAQDVLEAVREVSFDTVTNELASVQVEVQKTLAELSGKLTAQLGILEDVQKAIVLKQEELQRLHQIEAAAMELDDLKAQIDATKEEWEQDKAQWKREFEEMKSDNRKQWARDEADHLYSTEQKRRAMADTLTYEHAQKEKTNREKQEQLEKQWAEREALIKKAEQELAELRTFKEQEPERIKKAVNEAVAVANNSLKKEYEHQKQIALKDAEMEKKLADQTAINNAQTITKLQSQIESLEKQVEVANQRAAETAAKALESASGRATTEALQRMMESEKSSSKTSK